MATGTPLYPLAPAGTNPGLAGGSFYPTDPGMYQQQQYQQPAYHQQYYSSAPSGTAFPASPQAAAFGYPAQAQAQAQAQMLAMMQAANPAYGNSMTAAAQSFQPTVESTAAGSHRAPGGDRALPIDNPAP